MQKENQNSINRSRRKLLFLAGAASAGALLSPLLSKAAPSTIIEAGSNVDTASYIIFKDGNMIYAKNGTTGKIEFQGTDASGVINDTVLAMSANGGGTLHIKNANYNIAKTLNFTGVPSKNFCLDFSQGARFYAQTDNKPVMDFTSTIGVVINNGLIIGDNIKAPNVGILFARTTGGDNCGEHAFYNTRFSGKYNVACLYNLGSEVNRFYGCEFYNTATDSNCVKILRTNLDNLVGEFKPILADGVSMSGVWLHGCRIVNIGGGVCNAVYIGSGEVRNISIQDSYLNSNGNAKISLVSSTGILYGPFSFNKIACEGTSAYSIYSNGTLYRLNTSSYLDNEVVGDVLYAKNTIYYSSIDITSKASGTLRTEGSLYQCRVRGFSKIYCGANLLMCDIEIPMLNDLAVIGENTQGSVIRTVQNGNNLFKIGSRTLFVLTDGMAYREVVIVSGSITISQNYHIIDTEGNSSTDELDTINGGQVGAFLIISSANSNRNIIVKHRTGNIYLANAADYTLSATENKLFLISDGINWYELGKNPN